MCIYRRPLAVGGCFGYKNGVFRSFDGLMKIAI